MQRLPHLRVIIDDEPQSGAWNMAVDEVLLNTAIECDLASLRFYRWGEPTASLGYFQREAEFLADSRLSRLSAVRRLTGGGTLVHDRELTYSLTLPASQRLIERPEELYDLVHDAIIAAFVMRGIPLRQRGTAVRHADEPLLCFAREDKHDVMLLGHKVLGSAQRRRRGAILQHGGLMLRASMVTKELPGIVDLDPPADLTELEQTLAGQIAAAIAEEASWGSCFTPNELLAAEHLATTTYSTIVRP